MSVPKGAIKVDRPDIQGQTWYVAKRCIGDGLNITESKCSAAGEQVFVEFVYAEPAGEGEEQQFADLRFYGRDIGDKGVTGKVCHLVSL